MWSQRGGCSYRSGTVGWAARVRLGVRLGARLGMRLGAEDAAWCEMEANEDEEGAFSSRGETHGREGSIKSVARGLFGPLVVDDSNARFMATSSYLQRKIILRSASRVIKRTDEFNSHKLIVWLLDVATSIYKQREKGWVDWNLSNQIIHVVNKLENLPTRWIRAEKRQWMQENTVFTTPAVKKALI